MVIISQSIKYFHQYRAQHLHGLSGCKNVAKDTTGQHPIFLTKQLPALKQLNQQTYIDFMCYFWHDILAGISSDHSFHKKS